MSTYYRLDLQTLGSQPVIIPKISPITAHNPLSLMHIIHIIFYMGHGAGKRG